MPTAQQKHFAQKRDLQEKILTEQGLTNIFLSARKLNISWNELETHLRRKDAPKSVKGPEGFQKKVGARELRFWRTDELEDFINRIRPFDFRAARTLLGVLDTTRKKVRA